MKQTCFFLLILYFCFSNIQAQTISDYNHRGDQYMEKNDFYSARALYTEGLTTCDFYSIRKLTDIWIAQPQMQRTMHNIIANCYSCLLKKSEEKNSNAMLLLAEYYKDGIGIEKDSVMAGFWLKETGKLLGIPILSDNDNNKPEETSDLADNNIQTIETQPETTIIKVPKQKFRDKYNLFLTYVFSPTMPIGISAGGFSKFGIMVNFKSSQRRPDYAYDCNNTEVINYSGNYSFEKEKWHSMMITTQVILPLFAENLFFSIGGGYGKRDLYNQILKINSVNGKPEETAWCYNVESSYKGVVAEMGLLFKYKHLLLLGGVNSISFDDFDGYAGIGFSF